MKRQRLLMLMFASATLLFASCGKEAENSQSYDPPGTVYVHIQNNQKTTVKLWPNSESGFEYPALRIDEANNFISNWFDENNRYCIDYIDVGDVGGLNDISWNIVRGGATDRAAVIPGHGYICSGKPYHATRKYARLYVVDYIKNALGEIIGAEVKYQSPWEWEPENI